MKLLWLYWRVRIRVRNKTIIGLKCANNIIRIWNIFVRNKTIIGLKCYRGSRCNKWNVRNKTIIGLKWTHGFIKNYWEKS